MIFLILLLALILRVININQSLWLDEAIGAFEVRKHGLAGILEELITRDNHTPLYYLVLDLWTGVFGYSEFALRSLSILLGLGTIYLSYLIAKHFLQKRGFLVYLPAIFLATSPLHVYYSQEARMYSMAAFFVSLAIYGFIKNRWSIYAIGIVGAIASDYMPIFILPAFWTFALIKERDRGWWKNFLLSHIPLAIFSIWWLPYLIIQSNNGRWILINFPTWKNVAGGADFKQAALVWMKFVLGRISLLNKPIYYGLVALASIPYLASFFALRKSVNKYILIILWLVVPLILGFLASFIIPAFIYFRFLYILPAFYLLAGIGISLIRSTSLQKIVIAFVIAMNFAGLTVYVYDKNQHRENWKDAVLLIESIANPNEVVLFEYSEPFTPYRWYASNKILAHGALDSVFANEAETKEKMDSILSDKNTVYYFEYLHDLSDPNGYLIKNLVSQEFVKKEIVGDFVGVGQITKWEK